MKVKIKQDSHVFKPVTLEITFQTAEELEMFRHMASYDITIPNHVYPVDDDKHTTLSQLLVTIHDIIVNSQRS